MSALAVLAAIGTPLALALALALPAARGLVWRAAPFAPVPALALALFAEVPLTVAEPWLILGATFGLDAVARLFLAACAVVWIAAAAAARGWMAGDPRATGFGLCFLMAMAGNLGLFLAADVASFYALFALMSFSAYGLVLHSRSAPAMAAARLYIGFVVVGELALFAGLALAVAETGTLILAEMRAAALSPTAVALMLAGFGAKLGVMPLHLWLPPAHGAAPAPASAVLSGAMIKAGLFGILSAVPLGTTAYADLGVVVTAAGLVTIFAAALLGVQEARPKAVLGYSSVSQMGLMALAIGAALMAPEAWSGLLPVLVFLAAHHGLAKGALFLGTGAFALQPGRTGAIVVTAALLVPALVLAGLPGTSGAAGKEALKAALAAGPAVWLPWLTLALTLSGVATTLLMARAGVRLWHAPPTAPAGAEREALALPFAGLALAALALPALWPALAGAAAAPVAEVKPGAVWPVLAGAALAAAAAIDAHTRRVGWPAFLATLAAPIQRAATRAGDRAARQRRALAARLRAIPPALDAVAGAQRLGQTAIAGLLVAVLVLGGAARAPDAGTHPDPGTAPPQPLPAAAHPHAGPPIDLRAFP